MAPTYLLTLRVRPRECGTGAAQTEITLRMVNLAHTRAPPPAFPNTFLFPTAGINVERMAIASDVAPISFDRTDQDARGGSGHKKNKGLIQFLRKGLESNIDETELQAQIKKSNVRLGPRSF